MSIASLSKYIISFLFAVLVVLSVLLAITQAENKTLQKTNAVLKEQLVLRDTAINEIDKNARENLLTFLSIEPTYNVGKKQTPSEINLHNGSKAGAEDRTAPVLPKVISYEKSNIAINYINNYWSMFTAQSSDSKK